MQLTNEQVGNLWGEFTWDFGKRFFIETEAGNFVWSDPSYGGDNTMYEFTGTFQQWLGLQGLAYGRSKGNNYISNFCGNKFILI